MRREFLFNILFLILINILIKPFYTFFIETEVQNIVGPEKYGLYFSLFNLSYIFQIFLDFGIHNYGSQYLAKDASVKDNYLSLALSTKGVLTFIFAIAIVGIGSILQYDLEMKQMLWLISINHIFISFIFFFRSSLAALGHYRSNSIISVLDKVIMIAAFFYVLFISSDLRQIFDIYDFITIRMATYILTTIIAAMMLVSIGNARLKWFFNFGDFSSLLRKSVPFAILVIFMGICNRTDAVMLERMLPDNGLQAGIYAASYRLYYAMNILGFLFSMLLLPMFSSLIVTDKIELQHLVELSLKFIIALSAGAVCLLYIFRKVVMAYLYEGDANIYGTEVLSLLTLTLVLTCIIYILGTLITASAQLRLLNNVFIAATIFNLSINIILIPKLGAVGAAWSTFMTEIFVVICQFYLTYKIVKVTISKKTYFQIITYLILLSSVAFIGSQYFPPSLLLFATSTLLIGIISIATKAIDINWLASLLQTQADK